ncbi:DRTGG domain-containing protein [Clostridium rectalis]|uniref:DRTGG domain-containing protein n=1 Tax=Clostridium rectalis TaxID=2040295 RepID=UPI000F640239|nr:DRTGG domain-containing protein [Clostridium rectalis]
MSKHEDVVKYITSLDVGTKISVRSMANILKISEGTVYKAIKHCDELGIVSTIPRIGTIRIEKLEKKKKEVVTFAEIVNIVDGNIVAGKAGIYKTLNKLVIGAMTPEAIEEYIEPGGLLIVGNREEVQKLALLNECGIIITGGFKCSDHIKRLANLRQVPVICSLYDSFTVATMINKIISETLVKKDILLVEDIMNSEYPYLTTKDTVAKWKALIQSTSEVKFPVINDERKVVGILTLKEMTSSVKDDDIIEKVMKKTFRVLEPKVTVAYASHIMDSLGIQFCPVIHNKKFIGGIKRKDIVRALQYAGMQPKAGENLESIVLKRLKYQEEGEKLHFYGRIAPEMLDPIGTASWSSLNMLMSTMAITYLKKKNSISVFIDNVSTYFMKPVQIDTDIDAYVEIIDRGRTFCKVMGRSYYKLEISMYNDKKDLVARSIISARVIRK